MICRYLRDLIINFLLAGRDTTAAALSWTTFLLAQHPEIVSKLRDEMDKIMAKERNVHRIPNFEELRDMHYLHAVVTESLRLYPPVAIDPKVAAKSDRMPSGYYVQEGMWVNYMPYAMGRNEKYYDNPLSFTPERWIDSSGKFIRYSPFRFPVFQGADGSFCVLLFVLLTFPFSGSPAVFRSRFCLFGSKTDDCDAFPTV
jgi:cytochrome P450